MLKQPTGLFQPIVGLDNLLAHQITLSTLPMSAAIQSGLQVSEAMSVTFGDALADVCH